MIKYNTRKVIRFIGLLYKCSKPSVFQTMVHGPGTCRRGPREYMPYVRRSLLKIFINIARFLHFRKEIRNIYNWKRSLSCRYSGLLWVINLLVFYVSVLAPHHLSAACRHWVGQTNEESRVTKGSRLRWTTRSPWDRLSEVFGISPQPLYTLCQRILVGIRSWDWKGQSRIIILL